MLLPRTDRISERFQCSGVLEADVQPLPDRLDCISQLLPIVCGVEKLLAQHWGAFGLDGYTQRHREGVASDVGQCSIKHCALLRFYHRVEHNSRMSSKPSLSPAGTIRFVSIVDY